MVSGELFSPADRPSQRLSLEKSTDHYFNVYLFLFTEPEEIERTIYANESDRNATFNYAVSAIATSISIVAEKRTDMGKRDQLNVGVRV